MFKKGLLAFVVYGLSSSFAQIKLEKTAVLNKKILHSFFEERAIFPFDHFDFEIERLPVTGNLEVRKKDFIQNWINKHYLYPTFISITGQFTFSHLENFKNDEDKVVCGTTLGRNVFSGTELSCKSSTEDEYILKLQLIKPTQNVVFKIPDTKMLIKDIQFLNVQLFKSNQKAFAILQYDIPFLATKHIGRSVFSKPKEQTEVADRVKKQKPNV